MKLADKLNGPDWIIWIVFAAFSALTIVLISGHGSWLIAGYNTASKEEKAKYDTKKLCTVSGIGMAIVTVLVLVMKLFEDVLPASFVYVSVGIIIVDCLGVVIVSNKICRK